MPNRAKAWILKAGLVTAAIAFVYMTRDTWLSAFKVLALSVAFSLPLMPLCRRLEDKGIRRGPAALISLLSCVLVLVFFLLIFVPYLITRTIDLAQKMSPTILLGLEQLRLFLESWGINYAVKSDFSTLITSALTPLSAGLARGGLVVISAAGHTAISLVIAYYLLTIRDTAGRHLLLLVPFHLRGTFLSALSGCKNAVLGYLSGLLKTSGFVGAATFFGLVLLRIDDALILALFMGVLEVLPYFGPILGAIPILISAVPMGLGKTALALLLVLLVQQLESSVVGPYFTASSTSIHPLTAVVGVFIGGSLFGIPGILLTLPLLVVLRSMYWSVHSASIHFDS